VRLVIPLILILIFAAALWWQQPDVPRTAVPEIKAAIADDFTLTNGQHSWSLASQRGRIVLLYFGYTACPDICPTALMSISQALKQMGPDELKQVRGLFISVDPERDSAQHVSAYAKYFHPNILGVTGSIDELHQVADMYGAFFQKKSMDSYTDYVMDHTASTYLIDQEGRLVEAFAHGAAPDQILTKVRHVLAN